MGYQPIENYGIIGDLNTVALVGLNGSIDFMCFPDFDSPTIFAALLDDQKGGNFQIHPTKEKTKYKQLYLPDTNILITRFLCKDGVGEITDFMPVEETDEGKEIIRKVAVVRGELSYRMNCSPRFNYARTLHGVEQINDKEVLFISQGPDPLILRLRSTIPLQVRDRDVFAEFTLKHGETAEFVLEKSTRETNTKIPIVDFVNTSMIQTNKFWKQWASKSNYNGRWMETVTRSALTLKLLTSFKYGSIIAAPTFSLPEHIGGERNWDYRYAWIRDASFTVHILLKLGYEKESEAFIRWLEKDVKDIEKGGKLSIMYRPDGKKEIKEEVLHNLEGYLQTSPVRIGNKASQQYQLDIYGELLEAVYSYNKYSVGISYDFWNALTHQLEWLCDHWEDEDNGIWEIRAEKKDFLYSKLMCWVAFDRGIKIAEDRSFPFPDKWKNVRDKIYQTIFNDYWCEEHQSFVQYQGSTNVDASLLLMPLIGFISPTDPRWLTTLEYIEHELVSDCVVYRYRHEKFGDGFKFGEGTFSMCSFWYVECLSRAGQLEKARYFFEKMLGYANHLGLYSEQLGFQGEHLGNFPQAFTHIGLISAAYDLNERLSKISGEK